MFFCSCFLLLSFFFFLLFFLFLCLFFFFFGEDHDLEGFGGFELLFLAVLAGPGAHLFGRIPVAELAGVFAQRLDLGLERFGGVDPGIGLLDAVDVQAFDLVRLVALGQQVREDQARAGGGEDGVGGQLGGGAVIGMVDIGSGG